jgi:hypothetical protein
VKLHFAHTLFCGSKNQTDNPQSRDPAFR